MTDIYSQYEQLKKAQKSTSAPEMLNYYVGFLRLVYLVHQNAHWKTKGKQFYGNHKMFQRLYKSAAERTDAAAEKLIGLFGADSLNEEEHALIINKNMNKYLQTDESYVDSALAVEKDFVKLSEELYAAIKDLGDMTLGLDDMIMANQNIAESSIFLLRQAKGE